MIPKRTSLLAVRALALSVVLVAGARPLSAAPVDPRFRRLVVVGDSLLAGFGNGGLVENGPVGQAYDAPALFARHARTRLTQPRMKRPGIPALLSIFDDNRNHRLNAGEVRRSTGKIGFRRDSDNEAQNLAVPGEDIQSVFSTLAATDVAGGLARGDIQGRDILKFLILGLPLRADSVSQLTRANDMHPTFLLVWLGNNDVLPMATRTNPGAATLSPAEFGTQYRRFLNRLADTGAPMAVANLPDVTQIAALRHAANEVMTCHDASGNVVAVAPDALLSIDLDRSELPVPPCGKVLDPAERMQVRSTVMAFNAQIDAAISEVESTRGIGIARVDVFTLFDGIAQNGLDVLGNGRIVLTTGYLGGLFGLDGTHPTRTGHALIANAFVGAVNARFGTAVGRVNVRPIARHDPLVNRRIRPAGEPPFGLIHDSGPDLGDTLDDSFGNIASKASDVLDNLKNDVGGFFDAF